MRQLLSFFLFAMAAAAQTGGWTDLFPDERLTDWTRIAIPPTHPPSPVSQWKIDKANRVLICEGNGGHDMLRYNREFQDFVIHVEWRFTPVEGETRYNSGVFVRNDADGTFWHQAQAGLAGAYLFGKTPVTGSFNLRPQMKENRVKPAGEWNTYEITCKARTISLEVNGAVVSEFTACGMPKGYVALEAEGYRIEFRNIRLRPL